MSMNEWKSLQTNNWMKKEVKDRIKPNEDQSMN